MEDLKCRKRVLRRLGYCTEQDVIDTKGRVACEIDTYDSIKKYYRAFYLIILFITQWRRIGIDRNAF
jgi:hypothetical protein